MLPMLLNRIILKCLENIPADRYPAAGDLARVLASSKEKAGWTAGITLQYRGSYFKLERVDYDTAYPSPYAYRFSFCPESEVIRRFVDCDRPETPVPASRLAKWFGKKE